jgi:hypothetical protein
LAQQQSARPPPALIMPDAAGIILIRRVTSQWALTERARGGREAHA